MIYYNAYRNLYLTAWINICSGQFGCVYSSRSTHASLIPFHRELDRLNYSSIALLQIILLRRTKKRLTFEHIAKSINKFDFIECIILLQLQFDANSRMPQSKYIYMRTCIGPMLMCSTNSQHSTNHFIDILLASTRLIVILLMYSPVEWMVCCVAMWRCGVSHPTTSINICSRNLRALLNQCCGAFVLLKWSDIGEITLFNALFANQHKRLLFNLNSDQTVRNEVSIWHRTTTNTKLSNLFVKIFDEWIKHGNPLWIP